MELTERKEKIVSQKKYVIDDEKRIAGEYTYPLNLKRKVLKRYYNLSMRYKYRYKNNLWN